MIRRNSGESPDLSASGRRRQQTLLPTRIHAKSGVVLRLDEPGARPWILPQRHICHYWRMRGGGAEAGSRRRVTPQPCCTRRPDLVVAFVVRPHRIDVGHPGPSRNTATGFGFEQYCRTGQIGGVCRGPPISPCCRPREAGARNGRGGPRPVPGAPCGATGRGPCRTPITGCGGHYPNCGELSFSTGSREAGPTWRRWRGGCGSGARSTTTPAPGRHGSACSRHRRPRGGRAPVCRVRSRTAARRQRECLEEIRGPAGPRPGLATDSGHPDVRRLSRPAVPHLLRKALVAEFGDEADLLRISRPSSRDGDGSGTSGQAGCHGSGLAERPVPAGRFLSVGRCDRGPGLGRSARPGSVPGCRRAA